MITTFGTVTVIVLRPGTITDHGTAVTDFTDPTEIPVPGCVLEPGVGAEDQAHRDSIERLFTIYAPAGTDLNATDRVAYAGLTYEVRGQPQFWAGIGTGTSYLSVTLRCLEG